MKPVLSTEEVVRLEDIIEREGTSKAELMELAGEFAANEVLKLNPDRVLVLVGFGNNGGDGWVAADILSHKGVDVDIVSPVEPDEIPAALARHVARRTAGRDVHVCVGPSRDELEVLIDKADVVVDAIFGTGFHGNLRAPFSIWIPTVNECADCVVSIDVPSGLNAETGVVDDDCIRAEHTVTMIAPKIGLYSADGPEYAGDLICGNLYDRLDEVIDDVDHAAEIVEPGDLVDYFAPLPTNIDKYSRGSVLIVAGSAQYPGAAIMAAKSAARAGAGYVAVAAPDACANLIRMALPSIPVFAIPSDSRGSFGAAARMTVCEIAKKYSCVLCGPGMTTSAGAMQVVSGLLELDVPLILDADALNCLAKIAIDGIDSNPEMYRREQPLVMTPHYRELSRLVAGDEVHAGDHVGQVRGDARVLLSGERVALNYLQRMSGIATYTHSMAAALEGTKTVLVDTRKTTPGMRVFEKAAVEIGGGSNHRTGLSDGVLLKDNHIGAAGGVAKAVKMARQYASFVRKIEVEVETLEQVKEAVEADADIIMLDNMSDEDMRKAVTLIAGRAKTECSGNVDANNIRALADLGVDYISSGALTHSAPILDLSLKHLRLLDGK